MELKKLIQVIKMQRGRYSKNPDAAKEKTTIEKLVDKYGGKLEVIAELKAANENDLLSYIKSVLGIKKVKADVSADTPISENLDETKATDKPTKKVGRPKKKEDEFGYDKEGKGSQAAA